MIEDKNFSDWFYQTTDNEDKPVVGFDKLMSNHLSQAESWMQAAYRAGYKKAKEETTTESKEPFYVDVEEVSEHEDGSATYSFIMDYEQLKKDMEAGTQGDWWDDPRSTEIIVTLGPHTKYVVADVEDIDDARRIARVPQLERIALAGRLFADIVEDFCQTSDGSSQHLIDALNNYREATK